MPIFSRQTTVNADGNAVTQNDTVDGAESAKVQINLTQGLAGTLTTRTDDNTGVITSAAHGLATSDFVSVFWTDGSGVEKFRANMDITSTTTDTITVDLGQGDVLPAATTAVIVGKVASRVVDWDGTAAGLIGFVASCGSRRGSITAQAIGTLADLASGDCIKHLKTNSPGYSWFSTDGSFAFTGDILILTAALGDVNGASVATFVRLDT